MNDPKRKHLSIVSPVYKAENLVELLVEEIVKAAKTISSNFEIILVEDGSPDKSWEKIVEMAKKYPFVKGVKLSRNFGQHYAITAGLTLTRGEWIVVMDCDLQDMPEEIPKLYNKAMEGYDLVFAQRKERQDSFLKKLSSKIYYSTFSYFTNTKQDSSVANFGIYHQKVVEAILMMKDHIRYFPTMSQWVGFHKAYLPVNHSSRKEGKSSYSLKKLLYLAFDNIIAFSDKPLRLTIKFGLTITVLSFLVGIFYLIKYLMGDIKQLGFTSLIISIWFLSGIIIFVLGIVGIYVGKNFEKSKNRPVFIIKETLNND